VLVVVLVLEEESFISMRTIEKRPVSELSAMANQLALARLL
jgi:hypothetical protein